MDTSQYFFITLVFFETSLFFTLHLWYGKLKRRPFLFYDSKSPHIGEFLKMVDSKKYLTVFTSLTVVLAVLLVWQIINFGADKSILLAQSAVTIIGWVLLFIFLPPILRGKNK